MTLAAIVLAAGHARRFGGNKLAADFRGEPLLAHALRSAMAAPVSRVILVCREAPALLASLPVKVVAIASDTMANSLCAGLTHVGDADGAFVFLGDMPLVPPAISHELAARIGSGYAAQPRCHGKPGHPVLLAARAFADILALEGDAGAGKLLRARDDVAFVETEDEGVLLDVDSAEDLARMEARLPAP